MSTSGRGEDLSLLRPTARAYWLDDLATRAVDALTAARRTVAVAESLTGGSLAARIADVPGAATVLRGGVVAYATDLKAALLGVERELLQDRGAVDPDVARQMADGARRRLAADLGLATTGVAGPSAQDGKAQGTLHVAVAWNGGTSVRSTLLAGPRRHVREAAAGLALVALLARLSDENPGAAEQGARARR